jgi:hypothetical protein
MELEEFKKEFQGKFGHSAYWVMFTDGEYDYQDRGACYSSLTYGNKTVKKAVFFFKKPSKKYEKLAEKWTNFILQSEFFKDAFITRSYAKGIEGGFEVDVTKPKALIFSAVMMLRMPWEAGFGSSNFSWPAFVQAGLTRKQALWMMIQYRVKDGVISGNNRYNKNHVPLPQTMPWEKFSRLSFKRENAPGWDKESGIISIRNSWGNDNYLTQTKTPPVELTFKQAFNWAKENC